MKASELRIGNYLMFSNMIQPDRIIAVDRRFFSSASIEEGSGDFEITPYYQPIPLTPEILEKAGIGYYKKGGSSNRFKYKEGYYSFHSVHGEIFLEQIGNEFSVQTITYSHEDSIEIAILKHLHQLQNLYWCLCGKELDIKLH